MRIFCRSGTVSAATVAALALAACSEIAVPGPQVAALPPGAEASDVTPPAVTAPTGPRASSSGTVRSDSFQVWVGYDADVALHPYTSGVGPCPEGTLGAGCDPLHGQVIRPSSYERAPFIR